ncbi:Beta-adaptin-like protein C [Porphyridium purpureum]|uniref:Beta-adaptin-like protein C n=1 Tax=Porphyridium purpureum TaxID=35688 RepID=A0A5J4YLT9_PORPP|nr:Beta-adaptin-like protein C [Porphyridium purpureum]|eukprot:POR1154..scf295_9
MGMKWVKRRVKKITNNVTGKTQRTERYYSNTYKGEIHELRQELNSSDSKERRRALKRVIGAMSIGKDVSALFTDVLKCVQTRHIEQKKLVYLYLARYAESQPELAILAINMFVQEASNPNPLVRALAIRTMSNINVDQVVDYLSDVLGAGLKDREAYVRKSAAIAVAKLAYMDVERVTQTNLLQGLKDLVTDDNAIVVSTAVASLCDIASLDGIQDDARGILQLDRKTLHIFLAALNETNEWGQVAILDAIASNARIESASDADAIVERVSSRLQHTSHAVTMSTVRLIVICMEHLTQPKTISALLKRIKRPLLSMVKDKQATQYVALRAIQAIKMRYPNFLDGGSLKEFFVEYSDQQFNKLEKLTVLVSLCDSKNVGALLAELKEYIMDADPVFVSSAIESVARVAVRLESALYRCVDVLNSFCRSREDHVMRSALSAIMLLMRSYPKHEFATCVDAALQASCVAVADTPQSKIALAFIVGTNANLVPNTALELLDSLYESFEDESKEVQNQLLTQYRALCKADVKGSAERLAELCDMARTGDAVVSDTRELAVQYERSISRDGGGLSSSAGNLLELDVANAGAVSSFECSDSDRDVFAYPISNDLVKPSDQLLSNILTNLGHISAAYFRPSDQFDATTANQPMAEEVEPSADMAILTGEVELIDLGDGNAIQVPTIAGTTGAGGDLLLLELDEDVPTPIASENPAVPPAATSASSISWLEQLGASNVQNDPASSVPLALPAPFLGSAQNSADLSVRDSVTGQDSTLLSAPPLDGVQRSRVETIRKGGIEKDENTSKVSSSDLLGGFDHPSASRGPGSPRVLIETDLSSNDKDQRRTNELSKLVVPGTKGKGLEIRSSIFRPNREGMGDLMYRLSFTNTTPSDMHSFEIRFNVNAFGLANVSKLKLDDDLSVLPAGETVRGSVALGKKAGRDASKGARVQVAIRCEPLSVIYFEEHVDSFFELLLDPPPPGVTKEDVEKMYAMSSSPSASALTAVQTDSSVERGVRILQENGFRLVSQLEAPKQALFFAVCGAAEFAVRLESQSLANGPGAATVSVCGSGPGNHPAIVSALVATLRRLLNNH